MQDTTTQGAQMQDTAQAAHKSTLANTSGDRDSSPPYAHSGESSISDTPEDTEPSVTNETGNDELRLAYDMLRHDYRTLEHEHIVLQRKHMDLQNKHIALQHKGLAPPRQLLALQQAHIALQDEYAELLASHNGHLHHGVSIDALEYKAARYDEVYDRAEALKARVEVLENDKAELLKENEEVSKERQNLDELAQKIANIVARCPRGG